MRKPLTLLFALLLAGCARTYFAQVSPILHNLRAENYDAALEILDRTLDEGTFLYHVERGTILSYAGRYEESNMEFEKAEAIREDLYTKSISKEALSLVTSDRSKPYRGEDFEDVLVNYFMAMNYLALGKMEDVLVECRKLNHKLLVLNDMYEHKNVYNADAFAEYLTGVVYESEGDYDDAFISYRAALEAYEDYESYYGTQRPPFLLEDLLRAADRCHFMDEVSYYREKYGFAGDYKRAPDEGNIFFIFENGTIPAKDEVFVDVPIPDGEDTYMARLAFATYRTSPPEVTSCEMRAGDRRTTAVLMEDIQTIAAKNLEDKRAREIAKAIARGTAKYLAYKGVKEGVEAAVKDDSKKEDEGAEVAGKVAGAIVNLFGVATEHADTRSWLSLPKEIRAARLFLTEGSYDVEILFYSRTGELVERVTYEDVQVRARRTTFLRHRIF